MMMRNFLLIVSLLSQQALSVEPLVEISRSNKQLIVMKAPVLLPFEIPPGSYHIKTEQKHMTLNYEDECGYRLGLLQNEEAYQILVNRIWHIDENTQLKYSYGTETSNVYIGGGLERLVRHPPNPQKSKYLDWMNVALSPLPALAQEITAWKDEEGGVYFQAKNSNFWLTKPVWNDNIIWFELETPKTAFQLTRIDFLDQLSPLT